MTKPIQKDPIPTDVSREVLARFWDTHSIADYWDELKPVRIHFKKLSHVLPVRLDTKTVSDLQNQASKKGIGATTFARMLLIEGLERDRAKRNHL